MQIKIEFLNERNKNLYEEKVLAWLKKDFSEKKQPHGHFLYNQNIISSSFNACSAMVALNDQKETVGYMIWNLWGGGVAEVDIIEVREDYRRRGIFKKMLSEFLAHFHEISVLSAMPIPKADIVFKNMGWESVIDAKTKRRYKILRPTLTPVTTLLEGKVIAVFSKTDVPNAKEHIDYYTVKDNLEKYKVKYYQIKTDEKGCLSVPLITPFHYEGYIGVFLNKKLIVDGKAKHIFKNRLCYSCLNLLVANKFEPYDLQLFKAFFDHKNSRKRPLDCSGKSEDFNQKKKHKSISAFFQAETPDVKEEKKLDDTVTIKPGN